MILISKEDKVCKCVILEGQHEALKRTEWPTLIHN